MGIEILNQPRMSNDFNNFNHSIADNMHQQFHSSSISPSTGDSRHPSSGSHQQLQPCNIDSRQNDLIAAELRRMQHAREEENNALLQLLGRQQQMVASTTAATPVSSSHTSTSSITNHAYHNSMGNSASANGPFGSTQMGNFMNNSALDMNPLDHANFMSSSSMNGGMNGSNLDSLSGMAAMSSEAARQVSNTSNSSSHFNKQFSNPSASSAPVQFDSQVSNFMAAAFMNNTGANSGNMDSLGQMNEYLQQQKNQLGGTSSLGLGSMSSNAFGASSTAAAAACEDASSQASSQEDPGWEEQYKSLRAYHMQNGHCKVPARFKSNAKLGRWVMTQRRQFTLLMQGFPSALTAERIRRLESLGFTWSVRPEPVTTWNKKFHELKAYKATFGNCMVPQRYQANPQLGTWVHTQRRQYKLMEEGKRSSMTKEKADALDAIGFFWAAKNCTSTTPLDSFGAQVHNSYEGSSSGDGHSPGAKAA